MSCAVVLLIVSLIVSLYGVSCSPLTWRLLNEEGPESVNGPALVYDKWSDVLVLFGGSTANTTNRYPSETWIYDVASNEWNIANDGAGVVPEAREYAYFGLVRVSNTSLFIVSHGIRGSVEFSDTWAFNLNNYSWTDMTDLISGPRPTERYGGHFGVDYNNNSHIMWLGGGFTATTTLTSRYIDTYNLIFDGVSTARWVVVHPQPSSGNQFNPLVPHGRCLQGSAVVDNVDIILFGGCMRGGNGGGPCPAEDSWVFESDSGKWTELERCATPRIWSAMAPLSNNSGKAVLYGGSDNRMQIISDVPYPDEEVLIADSRTKTWKRYLTEAEVDFPQKRFTHAMAAGKDGTIYMFGGKLVSNNTHLYELWSLSGDPDMTETVGCDRVWFSYLHLHGLFMIIAFGFLFPAGALIARYYRCKGTKAWFIVHVIVQISAVIFTIPAFILVFVAGASKLPTHPHAIIGIILMAIMLVQPINGILRPHIKEGKEKSTYRKIWEWFHRLWGISTIAIGFIQVTFGVFLIVPPQVVWIIWVIVLFIWVAAFVIHELIKWCCFCCFKNDRYNDREFEMKSKHP